MTKFLIFIASVFAGCTQSDFAGRSANVTDDTAKKRPDKTDGNDGDSESDSDGKDGDTGNKDGDGNGGNDSNDSDGTDEDEDIGVVDGPDSGIEIDEGETTHKAVACITANVKFTPGDGASCPKHYAAFTADDGSSPNFGCCPLPAKDILSKEPAQNRGTNCLTDEIITGVNGGSVMCTKINTKRYKLAASSNTCYAGSGASGGSGSAACGVPNATFQALIAKFGSDACIGQPYGSLIVSRTGKNCTDVRSSELQYKTDGQSVKMYE